MAAQNNNPSSEGDFGSAIPQPGYGCHIALARIALLTALSFGFYALYWTYVTWKQYRDHTGETAYPVWHALAQFVPIYGWFRFYAHVIAYKDLIEKQGMRNSLRIMPIMGIVVWVTLLGMVEGANLFGSVMVALIRIIMAIVVLCWIQFNVNRYWKRLESAELWYGNDYVLSRHARIGKGEILIATIGAIWWALIILAYLNLFPEYIAPRNTD